MTDKMQDTDLERELHIANERLDRAVKALAPKHKGGEREEYDAAHEEVLRLERAMSASRGDEYAETIPFAVKWDTGAPMPQLLVNDYRALLAFLVSEPDPNWDGSYVTVKAASAQLPEPLGLVEFENCVSAKLGAPNDEVIEGHPLNGKGLEPYRAQRVVNSRWLREIEAINSVHRMYRPESWHDLNHYVFWFHDSTFECIARSFRVETHRTSMKELLKVMLERLIA
ncbi:hypothetical protein ETAA8_09010 [Anatilimnocola aggregata]|uniref:Uncharacterized protein n=1 Tax=Anatilimnocola aggregata TaxID=2528021 RepID=A0A517Y6G8_9BACT|nr:hypothetical protein [Anatilimnocola aggregata]QDU25829.1 hypothetical protein ETAA8_09010 [Anatilimnocola aggregata]